ncbi:MAG: acyltransferase domain-containing protein, partial [Actinophytocola sp.]|uniref:acyltransferase domain-containing protein n=1 Tax=Actinophytocola sp. TaxID=1872138 RepID=UPI003D6A30EF
VLSAGAGPAVRPAPPLPPDVVFLFSGHGGQHTGMAAELYARWPRFREDLDTCAELAEPRLGFDLREVLFPDEDDEAAVRRAGTQLATMAVGQPVVFAVEYALAGLWRSFGVEPATVAGHSLGAYAAATTAGVLSCADAVLLVTERGRLMDEMPAGAMLAVSAPAERLRTRLGPRLSVAAVNGPAQCVVAGSVDAVEALRAELAEEGVENRRLHISAAAHSPLVEPALDTFRERVRSVRLAPPKLTWISDSTGRPVSAQEAIDPEYWVRHMRRTVNFAAVFDTVLGPVDGLAPAALVEVGPGRTLSGLARQYLTQGAAGDERVVVPSMPHVADPTPGAEVLLTAVGRLWQAGVPVTWSELHPEERLRRVPLPTYPFEPRRFRLDGDEQSQHDTGRRAELPAPRAERSAPVRPAGDTPPGDTEAVVAAAYSTILGLDEVDRHRDFFELGGDSLLAARVATILRRELGGDIGVRAVFGAPTVARLAEAIDRRRDAAS